MSASSRLRIWIEQSECVSAGRCVATAPELFHFDEDELAVIDEQAVLPDDDSVIRIARGCPNGAIHVSRDGVELEL
jgi:ferredoxin